MTEVTIAVLQVLLALLAVSSLGRGSQACVERAMLGDGLLAAVGAEVVEVAVRDFDDRLLDNVLI